jgi:uncharacterized protein (DUF983 family)
MATVINGLEIDDCSRCGGNNYRIFSSESVSCAKCGYDYTLVILEDVDSFPDDIPEGVVFAIEQGRQ